MPSPTATSSSYRGLIMKSIALLAAALLHGPVSCNALSFPRNPLRPISRGGGSDINGGDGGGKSPSKTTNFGEYDDSSGNDIIAASFAWMSASDDEANFDAPILNDVVSVDAAMDENSMSLLSSNAIRGGGGTATKVSKQSFGASLNNTLDSLQTTIFAPFRMVSSTISKTLPANPFQKKADDQSDEAKLKNQQQLLSTTKVQSVAAPGSQLVPQDVITQCATEANLIGGTLTPESLERTANMINRQYLEHGYVMNSVTGATLVPSSDETGTDGEELGHVELKVREVKLARPRQGQSPPVRIRFVEKIDGEDAGDNEPGQTQSYRTISGRTSASKIARMVKLVPGSHFCVFADRWSQLAAFPGSGIFGGGGSRKQKQNAIFSTIHAVRPVPTSPDGNTVELEIVASENKPYVSLEYGITKSLFSDQWEGELDLKHANVLGGGEVASINVRKGRGRDNKEDSKLKGVGGGPINFRMSLKDDYLSESDSGYDVEVYRDHVGVSGKGGKGITAAAGAEEGSLDAIKDEPVDNGSPLRTGASAKLKLPASIPFAKALNAKFERVDPFTKNDKAQCMTSMSADIGPYDHDGEVSSLPMRSVISGTATAGGKWDAGSEESTLLPYASGTINSQQILRVNNGDMSCPPTDLVMRHKVCVSSQNLPRHEAILLGLTSRIRGYRYNYSQEAPTTQQQQQRQTKEQNLMQSMKQFVKGGDPGQSRPPIALSKSISGSLELRVPCERFSLGRGNIVLFGDWCFAQAQIEQKLSRHSSLGVGLRKNIQGLPLKMDACITEHGSKGLFFGIGA